MNNPILGQDRKVLIIGNSLSYYNNLPGIIEEIGNVERVKIKVKCLCKPNYALIDHWEDGDLQRLIEKSTYDFVILQQGPSSQEWGKEVLVEYGMKIRDLEGLNNGTLAFYMVWPSLQYYHTLPGVIENYSLAADKSNALLIPVGKVWDNYLNKTDDFSIYDIDKFHPSSKGSFLAAMLIYKSINEVNSLDYNINYDRWIDEDTFEVINALSN